MKKVLLVGSLALIGIICLYHYVLYPGVMTLLDPGGKAWKYDINVSKFMENNITHEDLVEFEKNVDPAVYSKIITSCWAYNDHINTNNQNGKRVRWDSIVGYKLISKLIEPSGTKKLYFGSALIATYGVDNGSLFPQIIDYSGFPFAIVNDTKGNYSLVFHNVGEYETTSKTFEEDAIKGMEVPMQKVIALYKYYYNLPIIKIRNPKFWDYVSGGYGEYYKLTH